MGNKLEGTRDYLVSVAERTFGIDAYKRWQLHIGRLNLEETEPMSQNRKVVGVINGVLQTTIPLFIDSSARIWSRPRDEAKHASDLFAESMLRYGIAQPVLEAASLTFVTITSHNLPEAIVYKLAVNAITHVGIDILEAGINRARRFRPSPATLAV